MLESVRIRSPETAKKLFEVSQAYTDLQALGGYCV